MVPKKAKPKVEAKASAGGKVRSEKVDGPNAADDDEHQPATGEAASRLIDARIRELGDWRGETLARMRNLIREAAPEVVEEWKWMGTPVWSHQGILCTGETYKKVVKLTFAHGASLPDPKGLFNSSLGGNTRRAIDIAEGEAVNAAAFKTLIKAAVAHNTAKTAAGKTKSSRREPLKKDEKTGVVLLSGGNPQIPKGDGDGPVQAYIAAMPGWKQALGKKLDDLVVKTIPGVRKAVRWNSPFYGVEGQGYFLSFHVFARYVKVTFFQGLSLTPVPPGGTEKSGDARWIDVYEEVGLDDAQMTRWIKQAAAIPGWTP